jgi:hypothetical protein
MLLYLVPPMKSLNLLITVLLFSTYSTLFPIHCVLLPALGQPSITKHQKLSGAEKS